MEYTLDELMCLIKQVNRNSKPNPMPVGEVNQLRLRKYRDPRNTETVELPESLKNILAYDRNFLSNYNMPVIKTLQKSIDKEGVIHSDTPDWEAYYGVGMESSGFSLEELSPIWNDDPSLPALIRIDHVGDQAIFIYVTERDADGEYPIARMERNEFWLAESSLVEYLYFIISGSEDVNFTKSDLQSEKWRNQKNQNDKRDAALLELEDYHHDLWSKMGMND